MTRLISIVFLMLTVCTGLATGSEDSSSSTDERAVINGFMDGFHEAAARADKDRYLKHFTKDGVFMGTDDWERWSLEPAFKAYVSERFKGGTGWSYKAIERHIAFSPDRKVAWFDEITKSEKIKKEKNTRKQLDLRSIDEPLFEALRTLRLSLAQEQGVPPYVIFHDTTLTEMARTRPKTLDAMRYISGVGEQKLKHYGHQFLEEMAKHPLPELLDNNLSDTINETLVLHQQGKNAGAIALARNLKSSTIYTHLAEAIADGRLNVREVLPLDDTQYAEIINTLEMLDAEKDGPLKHVFEALNEKYDYGILRCVMAGQ